MHVDARNMEDNKWDIVHLQENKTKKKANTPSQLLTHLLAPQDLHCPVLPALAASTTEEKKPRLQKRGMTWKQSGAETELSQSIPQCAVCMQLYRSTAPYIPLYQQGWDLGRRQCARQRKQRDYTSPAKSFNQ